MPQDKCRCADGDISDNSALALCDGVVGDKDSAEEGLFEQRWKNKEAEWQHNLLECGFYNNQRLITAIL